MAEKTRYHVFQRSRVARGKVAQDSASSSSQDPLAGFDHFALVGQDIEANSTEHAVRVFVETAKADGVYVAIPARSFRPIPVKVETQTVVKVGAASG